MQGERSEPRHDGPRAAAVALGLGLVLGSVLSSPVAAEPTETVDQAMCRLIDTAARQHGLPTDFLTRLIWRESSFRAHVVSRKGAQGVAQFMPGTASERGLLDPFDPEQAIPQAARLLADHNSRFGNLGLAAAAYNGGPARVDAWLAGRGGLPSETRAYVAAVTGRSADDWAATGRGATDGKAGATDGKGPAETPAQPQSCVTVVASIRKGPAPLASPAETVVAGAFAPWGVQLAGNFSKSVALAGYQRAAAQYPAVLAGSDPMVIGTRLRFRGAQTFWRVRVPAANRADANALCARLQKAGGTCVVLKS